MLPMTCYGAQARRLQVKMRVQKTWMEVSCVNFDILESYL